MNLIVAVLGRVVDCAFFVDIYPYVTSKACSHVRYFASMVASMAWTMCMPMLDKQVASTMHL
jgi:hypothetical protein